MIEQIGYNREQHDCAALECFMCDGCSQMGFADAIRAKQRQPAIWLPGIGSDRWDHGSQSRNEWIERCKRLVGQPSRFAQARAPRSLARCRVLLCTRTGKQHAKVGLVIWPSLFPPACTATAAAERLVMTLIG